VPRAVVALVSADDFVSAVRVYADRVNDLLRRGGVPAAEAVDVAEGEALALLHAVVDTPETVIDLAGWWFARAIDATDEVVYEPGAGPIDEPISLLAGTQGEGQIRRALARMSTIERSAVVLRDCYDLPAQAVGVALDRSTEQAAELVASGRLELVAIYDSRTVPDLAGHSSRTTVDLVSLSRLADGTLEAPRAEPLRRHLATCAACEDVLEALTKGRRLAVGLPIIAMDDESREWLIARVADEAESVLPSPDEILRALDDDGSPGPALSPVLAVVVLVLAVALGIGIAALTH
jgi:DNA-directed RNA polymerase specialized sigma24 family protein